MAQPTATVDEKPVRKIDLKILSPSPEAPGGLRFPDTPSTTTVAALKAKIKDELPSHPPVERLRLICHGRISRDGETLEQILARAPVELEDDAPRVLHVCVTDGPPLPVPLTQPRSSSMPPTARERAARQQSPFAVPRHSNPHAHAARASRPTTPGPHGGGQPMNPAEIMNNLFNQHFAMLPQMLQNAQGLGQQRPAPTPPTEYPALPPELTNPDDMRRSQQDLRQEVLQDLHAQQPAQGLQAGQQGQQVPRTAPVTRSASPQVPTNNAQNPANPINLNYPFPGLNAGNVPIRPHGTGNVNAMPRGPNQQPGPNPHFQLGQPNWVTTGTTADGHQYNMAVYTHQLGANGPIHQPVPIQGFPQQLQHGHPALPHGFARAPLPMPPNMPTGIPPFGPPIGLTPRAVSPMRSASQGYLGNPARPVAEDRNQRLADAVVLLSTHLTNITRGIHYLGAQIAVRNRNPRNDLRADNIRDTIWCLQSIDQIESLLRWFDLQSSTVLATYPELATNPQFLQSQESRRQAAMTLAQLYEVVRNEVMTNNIRPTIPQIPTNQQPANTNEQVQDGQARATVNVNVPSTSTQPQIYILNNPSGAPYALLVGPTGQYSSNPLPPHVLQSLLSTTLPTADISREIQRIGQTVTNSTLNNVMRNRGLGVRPRTNNVAQPNGVPAIPIAAGAQPAAQAVPAAPIVNPLNPPRAIPQRQPREPDEMRDLLAPIVRNVWLLIRIGGFLWLLFGGNRSLWRPMILCAIVSIIWAVQAGMLGNHFDGFRRYLDRIVGAEPQRQRQAQPVVAAAQPDAAPAAAIPQQRQQAHEQDQRRQQQQQQARAPLVNALFPTAPTPEDLARHLVAERQNRNGSWLEQQFHNVERTIALFVASLWPGVGEQAVRLQEERLERARRDAEELQRRRDEEAEAAAAAATAAAESAALPSLDAEELPNGNSTAAVTSGMEVHDDESSASRVNKGKSRVPEEVQAGSSSS